MQLVITQHFCAHFRTIVLISAHHLIIHNIHCFAHIINLAVYEFLCALNSSPPEDYLEGEIPFETQNIVKNWKTACSHNPKFLAARRIVHKSIKLWAHRSLRINYWCKHSVEFYIQHDRMRTKNAPCNWYIHCQF